MTIRGFHITQKSLKHEGVSFREILFRHQDDERRNFVIHVHCGELSGALVNALRQRQNMLPTLGYGKCYQYRASGYGHGKMEEDILEEEVGISKIILGELALTNWEESMAGIVAVFMKKMGVENILKRDLPLVNNISKKVINSYEFELLLDESPLFYRKGNNFKFFNYSCANYLICREFNEIKQSIYSGSFVGLLPYFYSDYIIMDNWAVVSSISNSIKEAVNRKEQAILSKKYELVADLRSHEGELLRKRKYLLEKAWDDICY